MSDGTDNAQNQNGIESSGLYSQYAVDDSAIPNPRSSYNDSNPYRAPYATEEQNGLSMMKHLSKSEPDIAPTGDVRSFFF